MEAVAPRQHLLGDKDVGPVGKRPKRNAGAGFVELVIDGGPERILVFVASRESVAGEMQHRRDRQPFDERRVKARLPAHELQLAAGRGPQRRIPVGRGDGVGHGLSCRLTLSEQQGSLGPRGRPPVSVVFIRIVRPGGRDQLTRFSCQHFGTLGLVGDAGHGRRVDTGEIAPVFPIDRLVEAGGLRRRSTAVFAGERQSRVLDKAGSQCGDVFFQSWAALERRPTLIELGQFGACLVGGTGPGQRKGRQVSKRRIVVMVLEEFRRPVVGRQQLTPRNKIPHFGVAWFVHAPGPMLGDAIDRTGRPARSPARSPSLLTDGTRFRTVKVRRALAGLIAAAMLVAGCIGSDEESEPETSSTTSLAPTTTTLAPTTTVVRLLPEISWSMPARFGLDANSDGRIDVPNTAEYALNLPAGSCAGGCPVTTPTFTVLLSGADSQSDLGAIDDFTWEVRQGSEVVAGASSSIPEAEVQLAEGSYLVSLTVSAGGQLATATEEIIVADHLIVAIGDSYASGEGNPEANTIDSSGAIDRVVGIWADDGVGGPVAVTHRRAHRSTLAATPQAALVLEGRDDQSSVTLLFTARTGAEIDEGLLGPHPGSESEDPPEVPQIEAVAAMLGCEETSSGPRCNRTIDALTISIGGNDVGFNVVLGGLVLADPDLAFRVAYNFALNEVFRVAETGIEELPAKYAALDRAIRSRLEVDRVY
ncbi:MAG: hypothetical protein EX267_11805, partial [Acidimicrobiia bacterium]